MQELIDRIRAEGVHVGGGIVKVDGFINHQVDAGLMKRAGAAFADAFAAAGVDAAAISKVLTAEVSGIAPALAVANACRVPLLYARKHESKAMTDDYFQTRVVSRTKGNSVSLRLSKRYLGDRDRVLLIDDFLATGSTLEGLVELVGQSGAELLGVGCLIEKPAEQGRERLGRLDCPIVTLAKIAFRSDDGTIDVC